MKIFLVLTVCVSLSCALVIECVYSPDLSWSHGGRMYSCHGLFINTGGLKFVEELRGKHVDGKSNLDVKGFYTHNDKVVNFIPINLGDFFPNLVNVQFGRTQLLTISSNDLRQFSNLEYLFVQNNKLEKLDANLFQFTPKLRGIFLSGNLVKSVGKNVLSNLKNLTSVDFSMNTCISVYATTPQGIQELKQQLITSCPSPGEIETTFATSSEAPIVKFGGRNRWFKIAACDDESSGWNVKKTNVATKWRNKGFEWIQSGTARKNCGSRKNNKRILMKTEKNRKYDSKKIHKKS